MKSNTHTKIGLLVAAVVTVVTAASIAAAAQATPTRLITGTWTGHTAQVITIVDPASDEVVESDWSVRMTISVLNGRVVRLYTTIRSVCPGPGVRDHRVGKKWTVGRGPHVSSGGAFTVRLRGTRGTNIEIAGGLFASSGTGRMRVRASGGCTGDGTWKLTRTH